MPTSKSEIDQRDSDEDSENDTAYHWSLDGFYERKMDTTPLRLKYEVLHQEKVFHLAAIALEQRSFFS